MIPFKVRQHTQNPNGTITVTINWIPDPQNPNGPPDHQILIADLQLPITWMEPTPDLTTPIYYQNKIWQLQNAQGTPATAKHENGYILTLTPKDQP